MIPTIPKCIRVPVLGFIILPAYAAAQYGDDVDDEEFIELSPFEVTSQEDTGYAATHTLAGSRVRTDLRDVASSISVVTESFLRDTGATDQQSLLVYTTNTEVGGVYGNFSGVGGASTYNENDNLLRPSQNTRVRGLDSADNTQDFFLTEVPWDGYNVDRVEMQRGPNSILFGVGSPAGIINRTLKTASYVDGGEAEFRIGSHGSTRARFDYNKSIVDDLLALRVIALRDDEKFRQDPAFEKDERLFGTLRFEPKLFGSGAITSIRANFEHGNVSANRPRSLPPIDAITPWFHTGESYGFENLNKRTINPITTWNQWGNNPDYPGMTYPWFRESSLMGNVNIGLFYDANNPEPTHAMMPKQGTFFGRNTDGNIDGTIGGIEFALLKRIATYNNYARGAIPGGEYYSNVSLSDPTIFDFYNKLMDGPNKSEWQDWNSGSVSLSQTFFHNRLGLEVVYFGQRYADGQYAFLDGNQYALSVDINTHLLDGSPNPNVGRPFVSNSGQHGNRQNFIDRDNKRLTAFADFRFSDVMEESWITRVLGRHVLTGLLSEDVRKTDYRNFSRWASELAYTEATGGGTNINQGDRQIDWITYLGPSLQSASSASGARMSNIATKIVPPRSTSVLYYDSRWNAPDVAFDAPYTYYTHDSQGALETHEGFQADNPDNYVGWTTGSFDILSAERGDIRELYSQIQKARNEIESQGVTLQSYLFDGNLVATYGWRKDEVRNASTQGPKLANEVSSPDFEVDTSRGNTRVAEGQSRTWGVVAHTPYSVRERMPWGSHISLFYNRGENFKADAPRGDIFGNQIDNPVGDTKDYGFVLSTLEDRLSMKVTWYETRVANANLGADSAGFSSNLYYVWALPYWGATHALAALDGIADPQLRQGDWGWPWNEIATMPDPENPDGTIPDNDRIYEIVEDFFTNFPLDQHFADEYGLAMNVAAMRAGTAPADWYASIPAYGLNDQGVYDPVSGNGAGGDGIGLQPAYSGNLRSFGTGPSAVVDTTSKGVEIELNARLTDNWNMTMNVSKTKASRTAISPTIDEWIETYTTFIEGDAGLIRIWGGDTMRDTWRNNVLAPYEVLKSQIGSSAPEVSPWRFNLVTNYNFTEGHLSGVNVGLAYRWEDKRILGYRYDETAGTLDIDRPWYGPSEDHVDLWLGYGREINDSVYWRIQLNLRNVGEDYGLTPVNIQPDGSVALSRITEGMTWTLSNSISF